MYRGEPNGTEYFTTLDAIEQSGRDATTLFEGLQVEKKSYTWFIEGKCKAIYLMKILQVHMESQMQTLNLEKVDYHNILFRMFKN